MNNERKQFDPTDYKIIIQRLVGYADGTLFSGRVVELPDVEVFTASPELAYRRACMVITELQEDSENFPPPSGRDE